MVISQIERLRRTLPPRERLIAVLMSVLSEQSKALKVADLDALIIPKLDLTSAQTALLRDGNRTEIRYQLAWARSTAKLRGWINNPLRTHWEITEEGRLWNLD